MIRLTLHNLATTLVLLSVANGVLARVVEMLQ